jgi:hypothetical protein
MKLVKLFAESVRRTGSVSRNHIDEFQGTSAIHLEDQLHGGKKVSECSYLWIDVLIHLPSTVRSFGWQSACPNLDAYISTYCLPIPTGSHEVDNAPHSTDRFGIGQTSVVKY